MGFVNDQNDVFKGDAHRLEAGSANAFIEQVVVIANKDVGVICRFSCRFPRASLGDLPVNPVYFGQFDQFINM